MICDEQLKFDYLSAGVGITVSLQKQKMLMDDGAQFDEVVLYCIVLLLYFSVIVLYCIVWCIVIVF